ncbi:MAG: hypothetical protein PHP82_00280 [Candidatus ainarchaeum sp.]|nr:hypothetical protein [Candidatus ainarchaeum sp.]
MKISFVGCKEDSINIFKDVAEKLSKKVSGLELNERFVPFLEDLPIVALEETEESDFIFVFVSTNEDQKSFILEKLVDVELKTGIRILKAIEIDDFSDLGEEEFFEQKDLLVEKYVDLIVNILFNEVEFEPEDKDFGL